MTEKTKLLIVDDHPTFRKGLVLVFSKVSDIEVVGEAESEVEAVEMAEKLKPDLVILDIYLPDKVGFDTLQKISRSNPLIKFLILSNSNAGDDIYQAIQNGAMGYLSKGTAIEKIVNAVRDIINGENVIEGKLQQKLFQQIQRNTFDDQKINLLTNREIHVLQLLSMGLTDQEIADKTFTQTGTVRSHVSAIRKKLDFETRSQIIIFALENKGKLN
jgi:DNA-binding NarL/FixJ family response regulator